MKKFCKLNVSLIAVISLTLIAGVTYAQVPSWFQNPDNAFPPSKYLTATGSGNSMIEAKKNAKAEISKIFNQTIKSVRQLNTNMTEKNTGNKNSFVHKSKMQSQTSVATKSELQGVKIERQTSKFMNGRTNYFALAVLNKNNAVSNYLRKYRQALSKLKSNYSQAQNSESSLRTLRYLAMAQQEATRAQRYKNIVKVLQGMGGQEQQSAPSSASSAKNMMASDKTFRERAAAFEKSMEQNLRGNDKSKSKSSSRSTSSTSSPTSSTSGSQSMELKPTPAQVEKEFNQALQNVSIHVQTPTLGNICKGSGFESQLQGMIRREFNKLQLTTTDNAQNASVVVTTRMSANYTTKGRKSDKAIRWNVTISIKDNVTNRTVGTINHGEVTTALDKRMAGSRTRKYVGDWIKQDLSDLIVSKLLST
ncbi:MAG: LPP20 family lipoprotein [bacterium]